MRESGSKGGSSELFDNKGAVGGKMAGSRLSLDVTDTFRLLPSTTNTAGAF